MNVLSLFDGMSCARLALERSNFKIDKYYASEISKPKIKASKNYFPDNIYIGDVQKVSGHDYNIHILMGGSPCQGFSIMGDRLNFDDPRSGLIMEYFRILEELKEKNPDIKFLLENVSMDKECEIEISRRLGVLPVKINSALLSAQNRKRIYWTNIPGFGINLFGDEIEQPEDKGILLKDILQPESEIDEKYYLTVKALRYVKKRINIDGEKYCKINGDKSRALQEGYSYRWNGTFICNELFNIYKSKGSAGRVYGIDGKSKTLISEGGGGGAKTGLYLIDRPHGFNKGGVKAADKSSPLTSSSWQENHFILDNARIRKLTPIECCRLQTVPDNFFDNSKLSDNQQYSCLGDGWTIDVICHLLKGLS